MKSEETEPEKQHQQDEVLKTEQNSQEQIVEDGQSNTSSDSSQLSVHIDYEEILRQQQLVPIRPLGHGAFGIVYLVYDRKYGIVANKIILKKKYDKKEWEAAVNIHEKIQQCPFIMNHIHQQDADMCSILVTEYSNMKTLEIIAKQPPISLPSCILRTLMNQILEGMRVFHEAGFVHRDIKCDNILLHCPPGSQIIHAKISDFGFAKQEDLIHEQTYFAGTLPYMGPELFRLPLFVTQKVDIYALGITFYKLITHKYPVNEGNIKEQQKKMAQMKCIDRPSEIQDYILWDLLSKMLEFDPIKRITAAQALQHQYFTSSEAENDISKEQQQLADQEQDSEDSNYSIYQRTLKYDSIPSFIFPESEIQKFIPKNISNKLDIRISL
ncbi:MAG: putative Spindle assembly checkpoint kinase [Streblomastix strix]|uniref:Putative Spindle assembly checkpoint kinase n=1 Tax=Streblomastix strix TaxID=222440 RepID=A0A5J4U9E2_9EUKA|nr:MAG: putative Spindle assembly checkpoint kinase [Streblomastix strix]